jgi:hypothetical protein
MALEGLSMILLIVAFTFTFMILLDILTGPHCPLDCPMEDHNDCFE